MATTPKVTGRAHTRMPRAPLIRKEPKSKRRLVTDGAASVDALVAMLEQQRDDAVARMSLLETRVRDQQAAATSLITNHNHMLQEVAYHAGRADALLEHLPPLFSRFERMFAAAAAAAAAQPSPPPPPLPPVLADGNSNSNSSSSSDFAVPADLDQEQFYADLCSSSPLRDPDC